MCVSQTDKFPSVFVSPTTKFHLILASWQLNFTPFWCPQQLLVKPSTGPVLCTLIGSCWGHKNRAKFSFWGHWNRIKFGCLGQWNGLKFSCQGYPNEVKFHSWKFENLISGKLSSDCFTVLLINSTTWTYAQHNTHCANPPFKWLALLSECWTTFRSFKLKQANIK